MQKSDEGNNLNSRKTGLYLNNYSNTSTVGHVKVSSFFFFFFFFFHFYILFLISPTAAGLQKTHKIQKKKC